MNISPALHSVHALHAKLAELRARDAELTERIERGHLRDHREREEVRGALRETEAELEAAVLAPVAGGVDPTAWLPDEILWMILVRVLAGVCAGWVCRRWHAVCAGATAKKQAWQWRWGGRLATRTLLEDGVCHGRASAIRSLAIGANGKLYVGKEDGTVHVWSTVANTHLQILRRGHTRPVRALAVGKDGTAFSGSGSFIRVWSGDNGSCLGTLVGVTSVGDVTALAVAVDGTLYSGSSDSTIRVWSTDRALPATRTLVGHTRAVSSLALSGDGKLYSASRDCTVRVWSVGDGAHLATLEGHTQQVTSVAVGIDGTVYSGSHDGTLRVWSGGDGSLIRMLPTKDRLHTITIGAGNTVLVLSHHRSASWLDSENISVRVWNGGDTPLRHLRGFQKGLPIHDVVIGQDGRLFLSSSEGICVV
jgi:WD40 repeat protein